MAQSIPLLVVAGESSGEGHAAALVEALRPMVPETTMFGVGGDRMRAAGVEVIVDVAETAVVGLWEVVSRLGYFRRLRSRLLSEVERRSVRVALLVDFSGFNLRLARSLAERGVRVVWYISPQVWAWRSHRARVLGRVASEILVVFPFEVAFYRKLGIEATFVGHPLVDDVSAPTPRAEFRRALGMAEGEPLVALLPGSRRSEVSRLAPVLAEAAMALRRDAPIRFVVPWADGIPEELLAPLAAVEGLVIVQGKTRDALAHADVSVVASGSVTVEGALLGAPMVVVYRVSPATFAVVSRVVKVQFAAMPNLLLAEEVVPELLQDHCTPDNVARAVAELLASPERRARMRERLAAVRTELGESGASRNAAARVAAVLRGVLRVPPSPGSLEEPQDAGKPQPD